MNSTGFTLWLTGVPGAGKTTLAQTVAAELRLSRNNVEVLDGDEVRQHFCSDLTFSNVDRDINIMRIGILARLLSRNGVAVIVATVSPLREARERVRRLHEAPFFEVFVDCGLDEVMRRDPKGLYAKARRGELQNLTGYQDVYETPLSPDVHVRTDQEAVHDSVSRIIAALADRGVAGVRNSSQAVGVNGVEPGNAWL